MYISNCIEEEDIFLTFCPKSSKNDTIYIYCTMVYSVQNQKGVNKEILRN